MAAEAAANPRAAAVLRFTFCIDLLLTVRGARACASPKRESIQVAVFLAAIQTIPPTRSCRRAVITDRQGRNPAFAVIAGPRFCWLALIEAYCRAVSRVAQAC